MVGTLAGHTAFAVAARLTGWEKGAPGDWRQGPPLNQPLIPLSSSLLPTAVTGPKSGVSGENKMGRVEGFWHVTLHCTTLSADGAGEEASHLWQEGPRNPGTHTQLPFSGTHVPPFLQVQMLLQLAPQKPSGQGRWHWAPMGERHRVSLAYLTPCIGVFDTFPGGFTLNSTVGLVPRHPECSPVQPAWHWQCP